MSKRSSRKESTNYSLSLRPKQKQCFYQKQISIKFCEPPQQGNMEQSPCYEGPIFNKDGNCFTSSFILKSQQDKFKAGKDMAQNQNKYHNYTEQKSELLMPKPNSKNMHCNVCKEKYEDYREHILKPQHKKKIKGNQFNGYILELESRFKRDLISPCKMKEKEVTPETENLIIIDESSVEQIQMSAPRKQVKMDYSGIQKEAIQNRKMQVQKSSKNWHQGNRKFPGQTNFEYPAVRYPQQAFPQYYPYGLFPAYGPFSPLPNLAYLQNYLQKYCYTMPNLFPFPLQSFPNYQQMPPLSNLPSKVNQ